MTRGGRLAAGVALGLAAVAHPHAQEQQRPTFASRVELIAVDVSAVLEDGTPIEGLTPADFTVRIDGAPRPVVSAEFLRLDAGGMEELAPSRISDNRGAQGRVGRFVLVVFDDASFAPGDERGPTAAVMRFVETLRPEDRVGLALTSTGSLAMPTTDRESLRQALGRIAGQWDIRPEAVSGAYLGLAEGMDIALGNRNVFVQAVSRICQREIASSDVGLADPCIEEVETSAARTLDAIRHNAMTRTSNIAALMRVLAGVEGIKTIVLVSAGLMLPGDLEPVQQIAALAPAANATLHTIYVDNSFAGDVRQQTAQTRRGADLAAGVNGLGTLAGMARGSFQRLVGSGSGIFERLAREMSAVYRLGVEARPGDLDGTPHRVDVRLSRSGAIVRAHRSVVGTSAAEAADAETRLSRAIASTQPLRSVPARLTHFAFPGENGGVRVVLAGEVRPPSPGPVAVMYQVVDGQGRTVDSRLAMAMGDEKRTSHTPVLVHADLTLEPGPYSAKLAVLDGGGEIGAVRHAFVATLAEAGDFALSDIAFFPGTGAGLLAPRDRVDASAGGLFAYVEVTGPGHTDAVVTLELLDGSGATIMSNDVPVIFIGATSKAGAQSAFPLSRVRPGEHTLAASLWVGDRMLGRVSAPVTIEGEATRAGADSPDEPASIGAPGAAPATLAVAMLAPPFDRTALLTPDVVAAVRAQMAALGRTGATVDAFEAGLREFEQGRAEEAAVRFRQSLAADPSFAPALFYLAACYALGGRDDEASGAWQTALGTAPATPVVYAQLADALLRQGRAAEARVFVDEGLERWEADAALRWRGLLADAADGRPVDLDAAQAIVDAHPALTEARFTLVVALRERWNAADEPERSALAERLRREGAAYVDAGGRHAVTVRRWLTAVR